MKFSLNKKAILLIVSIAILISLLTFAIYLKGIRDLIQIQFEERTVEIARMVAADIDTQQLAVLRQSVLDIYEQADNRVMSDQWGTPAFETYVSQYESVYETEEYRAVLEKLRRMQGAMDVDCLYLIWLDRDNVCYVYLVDADLEEPCPVGCIDPLFANEKKVLENADGGIPPTVSNTAEYGWLLATGMPIYDEQGEILAYATVDISMNELVSRQNQFLLYILLAFLLMIVIVSAVVIFVVNRALVKPINTLSQAAMQYARNRNVFSSLKMDRNDELGVLAASMKNMEDEINSYIDTMEKTTAELIAAREQAKQMDHAANIDALTKVRNKRAYDVEADRLDKSGQPYGVLMVDMNGLKKINDTYGHEKGDISIKTVCRNICHLFKHSPVFRVGGDEFIVLLSGTDYEERDVLFDQLSETFRRQQSDEKLPPWERVTAATGFAEYDAEKDECIRSVQKRADAAMYENKRAWKKQNEGYAAQV